MSIDCVSVGCCGLVAEVEGAVDGFDDLLISGAAAEVSGDGVADFVLGHVGAVVVDGFEGHEESGGAEAALESVAGREGFLEGVEGSVFVGEAFDGLDDGAFGLDGEGHTGSGGFVVDEYGAGSADAVFAADACSSEAEVVAEEVREECACFDFAGVGLAVDLYFDGVFAQRALLARSVAVLIARSIIEAMTRRL